MPAIKRKLRVFLLHSHVDKENVNQLHEQFCSEDWIDSWIDVDKLYYGNDWKYKIGAAIRTADVIVVCLSNGFLQKEGYVHTELNDALSVLSEKPANTIFLVPLRLENCDVPYTIREKLHFGDYFGEYREITYKKLITALKTRLKQVLEKEGTIIRTDVSEGGMIVSANPLAKPVANKTDEMEVYSFSSNKEKASGTATSPTNGGEKNSEIERDAEIGKVVRMTFEGMGVLWGKYEEWRKIKEEEKKNQISENPSQIIEPSRTNPKRPVENKARVIDVPLQSKKQQASYEALGFIPEKMVSFGKLALWIITVLVIAVFVKVVFGWYGLRQIVFNDKNWIPLAYGGISLGILKALQSMYIKGFLKKNSDTIWWSISFYVCQLMVISNIVVLQVLAGAILLVLFSLMLFSGLLNCGCVWPYILFIIMMVALYLFPFNFGNPFVLIILNELYFGLSGLYLGVERN